MDKEPETYEELIRMKRCVDLTKDYEITKDDLEKIYNFLRDNPDALIKGTKQALILHKKNEVVFAIMARCINPAIDGIYLSNSSYTKINHYTSSGGSSGSSSGGGSSNNNNNNNNNR